MFSKDPNNSTQALPDALAKAIAEASTIEAAPERTDRVRSRLFARIHAEPPPTGPVAATSSGFITLHDSTAGDGWVGMLPKADVKLLFTDGEAESYMIRLQPGAWAPAHDHPADEECLVLEGSLWLGDVFLKAGDFHVARPGMRHGELRTETGAMIFIRYCKPIAEYLKM